MRRGEHLPNIDWMASSLDGKVLGLVGMGDIAREVAKKFYVRPSSCQPFNDDKC